MPKEYFRFPYHAATSDLIRFLADFLPWTFVIERLDSHQIQLFELSRVQVL